MTTPTFTASGVKFKATDAKATVKRANVLMNANGSAMSYQDIVDALYANKLQASQLFSVVLAYDIDGEVTGIQLPDRLNVRLAGQRKDGALVGSAPNAHSFVKNQAKLLDADKLKGTVTIGEKSGDYYFGYRSEDSTYNAAIASVSANYEGDEKLYKAIIDLVTANPDKELLVYFVPTVDFSKWVAYQRKQAAKSA
jgi:hypothetical protein